MMLDLINLTCLSCLNMNINFVAELNFIFVRLYIEYIASTVQLFQLHDFV